VDPSFLNKLVSAPVIAGLLESFAAKEKKRVGDLLETLGVPDDEKDRFVVWLNNLIKGLLQGECFFLCVKREVSNTH
jgi:hypothetical protein